MERNAGRCSREIGGRAETPIEKAEKRKKKVQEKSLRKKKAQRFSKDAVGKEKKKPNTSRRVITGDMSRAHGGLEGPERIIQYIMGSEKTAISQMGGRFIRKPQKKRKKGKKGVEPPGTLARRTGKSLRKKEQRERRKVNFQVSSKTTGKRRKRRPVP